MFRLIHSRNFFCASTTLSLACRMCYQNFTESCIFRYRKRNARANRDTCKCLFLSFACFSRFLISEDFRSFRFGAREYFFCVKVRAARLISRKERLHRQTPVPIIVFKNTTHRDIFFNSYVKLLSIAKFVFVNHLSRVFQFANVFNFADRVRFYFVCANKSLQVSRTDKVSKMWSFNQGDNNQNSNVGWNTNNANPAGGARVRFPQHMFSYQLVSSRWLRQQHSGLWMELGRSISCSANANAPTALAVALQRKISARKRLK